MNIRSLCKNGGKNIEVYLCTLNTWWVGGGGFANLHRYFDNYKMLLMHVLVNGAGGGGGGL